MFAWNAFILTKQTITSCSVTEKFRKVNFPSHDRICDDRIRHLNHFLRWKCYGLGWNLSWWSHSAQNFRYSWSYRSAISAKGKLWSRLSTWHCKMSRGSCLSRLSEPESHRCFSLASIITGSVTNWTFDELARRVRHRQNPPETLQELRDALVNEWNNIP